MTHDQRVAIAAARGSLGAYAKTTAIASGIAVVLTFAIFCGSYVTRYAPVAYLAAPLLALVPMLLVALPGYSAARRRGLALRDACSAAPPMRVGEPPRCYVCGAPLATVDAIDRCAFCHADNVVDADILARAGEEQSLALDDYADDVRARASVLSDSARVTGVVVLYASVMVVPLFTSVWLAALLGADHAIPASVTYRADTRGQATCLQKGAGAPRIRPNEIIGRALDDDFPRLVVVGIVHNGLQGGDIAVLGAGAGFKDRRRLDGLCIR